MLNLVQSILHPRKSYPRIKQEVDVTTRCKDIRSKIPRWQKFEGHVTPNDDEYQKSAPLVFLIARILVEERRNDTDFEIGHFRDGLPARRRSPI